MKSFNRRNFLGLSGSVLASGFLIPEFNSWNNSIRVKPGGKIRTPVIHSTDLYHAYADPDDHWDLASVYALAYRGLIDLKGIVIDYPTRPNLGDPDIMAVAQLNYYTGLIIPAIVGTSHLMKNRNDKVSEATLIEMQAINWIIDTLQKSTVPVAIHIVGTSTNVAIAIEREPELFYKKCAGIYLNSGSGHPGEENRVEYNVSLDRYSYGAIFDAPCPVYWMPCVNVTNTDEVGEYGTYYRFFHKDILPFLPDKLKNYFCFMYGKKQDNNWFDYMNGVPEDEIIIEKSTQKRNMWCTAGFLISTGKKVTSEGEIVDLNSVKESVFSFKPVSVTCDEKGFTSWKLNNDSKNRFIFHVDDLVNYQQAMTLALKNLLLQLPK